MRNTAEAHITVESAAALFVGALVSQASSGLWAKTAADARVDGVVVTIGGETAAPYTAGVETRHGRICQVLSDGAGAIDEGDPIAAGATAGQAKVRAIADGATTRYWAGFALSPAAATQALYVDLLFSPFMAPNT